MADRWLTLLKDVAFSPDRNRHVSESIGRRIWPYAIRDDGALAARSLLVYHADGTSARHLNAGNKAMRPAACSPDRRMLFGSNAIEDEHHDVGAIFGIAV